MEFWNSLKESSRAALNVVSNDLAEFTSTVQEETSTFFDNDTTGENEELNGVVDKKVEGEVGGVVDGSAEKKDGSSVTSGSAKLDSFMSMSSISASLGTFTDSIYQTAQTVVESLDDVIKPDAEDMDSTTSAASLTPEERLVIIRSDRSTYSRPPNQKLQSKYEKFVQTFQLDSLKRKELQDMLQNPEILSIYHELVPAEVEEDEFWRRYFFWKGEVLESDDSATNQSTDVKAISNASANDDSNDTEDKSLDWEEMGNDLVPGTSTDEIDIERAPTSSQDDIDTSLNPEERVKANNSELLKVENSVEIEKSKSSTSSEASWTVVGDGNDDNVADTSDQPQATTVSNNDNAVPNDEKEDDWDESE